MGVAAVKDGVFYRRAIALEGGPLDGVVGVIAPVVASAALSSSAILSAAAGSSGAIAAPFGAGAASSTTAVGGWCLVWFDLFFWSTVMVSIYLFFI